MKQVSRTDHRIFGSTELGQLRVNLYNGAGLPAAGSLYSWLVGTDRQLVYRLESWYGQPLNEDEEAVLSELVQLSPFVAETDQPCDECGGSGVDLGGLNAYEPEDCPVCQGAGRETVPALVGFGNPASAPRIASIGNGLYLRTRKAVA